MFGIIKERLRQGTKTLDYPRAEPFLPERFKGRPVLKHTPCDDCRRCETCCPTEAIHPGASGPCLDLGRCIFCGLCAESCPRENIVFSREHRMAACTRAELCLDSSRTALTPSPGSALQEAAEKTGDDSASPAQRLFRRSLKLRQVSCGGCGACEADVNVLGTLLYDLGRFGIEFVASPRHADGLLITGPVSRHMYQALLDTYAAVPRPKLVIAVGSCAISGGLFAESPACHGGVPDEIPVDLYVPGCPPNPWTTLDALLRLAKKL